MKLSAAFLGGVLAAETITKNNVLMSDITLGAAYQIDFDLNLTETIEGSWSNILSVYVPGASQEPGIRIPSIMLPKGSSALSICSYIQDNYNKCFNSDSLNLNESYAIKISQYEEDIGIDSGVFGPQWMYEISINNEVVYKVPNPTAREFEGVTVSMCKGTAAIGTYDNFNFQPNITSSTPDAHTINPNLDQLFIDQYKMWSTYRDRITGYYCDGMSPTNANDCGSFFSSASTGWGLMIDAVAAEVGLIDSDTAKARAKFTMRNIDTHWPRDANGWYAHWTERDFSKVGEYSTIDSSIMIAGAYFAAKYFNDPELIGLAEAIGGAPDFDLIFDRDNREGGNRMYMVSDPEQGAGLDAMKAQTAPFNEYMILAYLAMVFEKDVNTRAKTFYEDCFGTDGKPVGRDDKPYTSSYNGNEMLSDYNHLMTTFAVQFPWFAVRGFHDNSWYTETLYPSWYQAERDWWTRSDGANITWSDIDAGWGVSGLADHAFGCGAGDSITGYTPSSMSDSENQVWSAANMAPFMAIPDAKDKVEEDLNWLYDNNVAYTKNFWDGSTAKVLWRYSADQADWRASWSTSVDYSTMVLGYALKYLPENFYPTYNSAIIDEATTTPKPTTTKTTTTTEQMTDEDWCEANPWPFHVGKRGKVLRRGENSLILRVKQPVPKSTQYTTMIAFSRSLCGGDFIKSIAAGEITVDLLDNEAMWTQHDSYFRDDRDMSRFVVNFMKIDGEGCDKCLGNNKIDNYDMIVSGIKDIKWKTNAQACIQGAKHAFVGCKNDPVRTDDTNATKCAAWQKLDTKMNMKNCPK